MYRLQSLECIYSRKAGDNQQEWQRKCWELCETHTRSIGKEGCCFYNNKLGKKSNCKFFPMEVLNPNSPRVSKGGGKDNQDYRASMCRFEENWA